MAQHDDKQAERLARELAKYEALDTAEIDEVIRTLLELPKGQKFLWWLLQIGKYGVNPFSPDPVSMGFQCGEQNIGAQIMSRIIEVNPMGFAQMQLERKLESDRRDSTARSLSSGDDLFANSGSSGEYPD